MNARPAARRPVALLLAATAVGALAVVALFAALGVFDHGLALDLPDRLARPGPGHWFGTDALGRDVFGVVAAGTATSVGVALGAVLAGLVAGVPLGLVAAARGGVVDALVGRLADLLFAFPALVLALLLVAALGPGPADAVIALGLFNTPVYARVARAGARVLLTRDFVLAARLAGKGRVRIAFEHVLPNLAGTLLVQTAIQLAVAIAAEAGLSYAGIGAQPPTPSWGRMLADAQTLVGIAPWLVWFPGSALSVAVLAFGALGTTLQTHLDPRRER